MIAEGDCPRFFFYSNQDLTYHSILQIQPMLTVYSLTKSYGLEIVLNGITFSLNIGERLGLVGPNGCGKTTLLRILAGEEQADSGGFRLTSSEARIGYLPQGLVPEESQTIGAFIAQAAGDLEMLSAQLQGLALALANSPMRADLQRQYDRALAGIELASQSAGRAPEVLAALGLDQFPLDTPTWHLSGGQKTRLALAGVLLSAPQLLLLDEPTNHLDIDMLAWLESWLVESPFCRKAAVLIVSHDRTFLDRSVTGILELDGECHTLRQYPGNYSDYLEARLSERQRQWQAYSDQQEEIARLRAAAARVRGDAAFRRGGKGDSGDKFAKGFFSDQTSGTMARAKHIERRLERLTGEDRLEKPKQSWQMKLEFNDTPTSGRDVLALEGLSVGYGEHVLLEGLNQLVRYGEHLALIGPNGAGKTTLLRTVVGQLLPLAGRVRLGANVQIGYMAQEQETLDPQRNSLETIQRLAPMPETEARAFLHKFLFSGDEVFTPVGLLSYGERARLSLGCLVAGGCNLLLLDEPINHLDIPSRSRFEQALVGFEGTVIAVVHDRYFIEGFATSIWEARNGRLRIIM
jgi:ATP-binding cassette subfamily F protein 3